MAFRPLRRARQALPRESCEAILQAASTGVRSARKTDTFFKRFTAEGFYKLMQALGVDVQIEEK